MVIGTSLYKDDDNPYYSPPFARMGLAATFAADIMNITATDFSIDVEHKNFADTSWANAGSFAAIGSTGVKTLDVAGLKEEIRFVYGFTATNPYDGVHFNMLAPAWRPF